MKNSISYVALCLGIVAIMIAASQSSGTSETATDTLTRVQSTGRIEACTVINPPTTIKNASTGELSGHMVDTMELIAERIDAKIVWHESTWGNAALDIQTHRCDVVVAPFFANITRAQAVAFTQPPLFYMGHGAVVRADDGRFKTVTNAQDFDREDLTVVVATGEVGDIYVSRHFEKAVVVRIDVEAADLTRFMLEVSSGRADVAISGSDVASIYTEAHPEVQNVFAERPFGITPVGWAVRHDDVAWRHFLETSLVFLETQGELKKLEDTYDATWIRESRDYTQ